MKRQLEQIHDNEVEKKPRFMAFMKRKRDCHEMVDDIQVKKMKMDRKRMRNIEDEDDHCEKRRCIRNDSSMVDNVCTYVNGVTTILMTLMMMASYTSQSYSCPLYSNLHLYIK